MGHQRASAGRAAKQALFLGALALAFGFIGVVAAVADAVWFHLPSGVAQQDYVSVGRRASLSKRVEGVAAASVRQIRAKVPEAEWLTVERLYEVQVGIDGDGGAAKHRLLAEGVSASFFDALGVTAAHGGVSAPPDVAAVVLGHAAWQRLFGASDVAGETLTMQGEGALAIAGVAPRGFQGLLGERAELWILEPQRLPSNLAKSDFGKQIDAAIPNKHVFGVLRQEMSLATLHALLADLDFAVDPAHGSALGVTADDRLEITLGLEAHPDMRAEVMSRTRWLIAVVVCMFVLALVTLVDSLLAQQNARAEERRLRVAVGATPAGLYGLCLAENAIAALVMALLAAAAGAYIGNVLLAVQPFAAWLGQLPPGSIALGCAVGAAALALAYGLAAAYAVRHVALASRSTSTATSSRRSPVTRRLLLLAATVSLLLVASVAERYWREADIGLGFAGERVLLVQVWADQNGGMRAPSEATVRGAIEALPQARATARMDLLPLVRPLSNANWARIVGDARFDGTTVLFSGVRPAYFRTLGVPLLAGRLHEAGAEVVVSRSLAKRLGDFDANLSQALGQAIRVQREAHTEAESERLATVVGVVEDIAYGHYLDGERAVVYGDSRGAPWDQRWAIDHEGEAAAVMAGLRQAKALEGFEVAQIGTPASLFRTQFMARRSVEILLAGAASLALVLALAGIAASQARHLAEHRRAIGISLAVGATGWQLGMRYLDGLSVDFAIAAALPCLALVAAGVVFPLAMSGVQEMLAPALILPVLALIAALSAAIVCLAVGRYARTDSPAALLHGAPRQ